MNEIKRGEIYYINSEMNFQNDPSFNKGCYVQGEQAGTRPGVIISNDIGNAYSPTVVVAFLTSKEKKWIPTHVHIKLGEKPNVILTEQMRTISKDRISDYVGSLSEDEMERLDRALLISMGIKRKRKPKEESQEEIKESQEKEEEAV